MRTKGSTGFAILLIACGALILLGKFGVGTGHIMGYLVPLAMAALGWYSIRRGSRFIGWVMLILGLVILLGKLSGLIGLLIAIGMIGYGISMLKRNKSVL